MPSWAEGHLRTAAPALPLALALATLALAQGCKQERPAAEPRRYTVRGVVVKAADPGAGKPEVLVRHEAIPDFTDRSGKVVGMASMVMPFAVVPASLARELAVGDEVEIRFSVDWGGPSFAVERLEKLAPAAGKR